MRKFFSNYFIALLFSCSAILPLENLLGKIPMIQKWLSASGLTDISLVSISVITPFVTSLIFAYLCRQRSIPLTKRALFTCVSMLLFAPFWFISSTVWSAWIQVQPTMILGNPQVIGHFFIFYLILATILYTLNDWFIARNYR